MQAKLKVSLLEHTPDPEKVVAAAAKLCYSQTGVDDILDNLTPANISKFLDILSSYGHESPLEHVSFTFAVEGVSRALSHQLVRHRIASYSQQSQRYVKLSQFSYIIPPEIDKIPAARQIYVSAMEKDQEVYNELVLVLLEKYKFRELEKVWDFPSSPPQEEIDKYFSTKKGLAILNNLEKKAIEDARYVFPNSCETKIVFTMNARTLLNFFRHRVCNRAQWEIRAMAEQMLELLKLVAPTLFKLAGPPCVSGPCHEGTMSCNKSLEMRRKYGVTKE